MNQQPYETAVTGVGVWLVGVPDAAAWASGVVDDAVIKPVGNGLDKRNRRRASQHARALSDVYAEALAQAGADAETVATVFGSSLGEAGTMIKLLDQIHREKASPSPMAFAMSVHNAASGLVSIGGGNRGFTTSIAADYDTPAMAIAEAVGVTHRFRTPVVVACSDEAAPPDLVPEVERFDAVAAALVIEPADTQNKVLARLRGPLFVEPTIGGAEASPEVSLNPQMGLLDLVDAIQRGKRGMLRLDRGRGRGWCVAVSDG